MTRTGMFFIIYLFYLLPLQMPQDVPVVPGSAPARTVVQGDRTGQLQSMIDEAKQMLAQKQPADSVNKLISEAFHFAKKNQMSVPYQLYWLAAEAAFIEGNFFSADAEMEKAMKGIELSGNTEELISANNLYSRIKFRAGEFSKAIDICHKNMKRAKDHGMNDIFLESVNRLAIIYGTAGNTPESKKYYHVLFIEAASLNDTTRMTEALFRLGDISRMHDKNFSLAQTLYKECINLARTAKDTNRMAWTMNHMAWNFYLNHELDSALRYFNQVIKLATKAKIQILVTNSLGNIGTIYRDKQEYKKAEKYYNKSLDMAISMKSLENIEWIHEDISAMYLLTGDFKKAYYHYVQYKLYFDSLNNLKFEQGLAEARMKFDVDQQKKELEVLSLKLDQQRWFTWAAAALIVLVVVIGLLAIRQFRLSAKKRISEMNHRIAEITQANLRQQMNPHFIFNTLNSIQYYMYQHDKVATNTYLTKFSSLIRKILENSQHTSIPIRDEMEALQLYLELEKLRFKEKFTYEIEVDDEIDTLQYKIPTMLIQPYVENAICHGIVNKEDPGYVKIVLSLGTNYISCLIEDNGIGREAASEIRKSRGYNHNSLGTRITESRLDLVNSLYGTSLKVICTDLKDETGNATGTRVEIHIPLMA
jgi:tetratricopeptide (TPR) repeat protein